MKYVYELKQYQNHFLMVYQIVLKLSLISTDYNLNACVCSILVVSNMLYNNFALLDKMVSFVNTSLPSSKVCKECICVYKTCYTGFHIEGEGVCEDLTPPTLTMKAK